MSGLELVATRGLPGSGKSTWARRWVEVAPADRARVNRDDTRAMLHGGRLGTPEQERMVTLVCHGAIRRLLLAGVSVVEDSTNLPDAHLARLWEIAQQVGARFRVADFTAVPLATCVARDGERTGPERVGFAVIHRMHREHLAGRWCPLSARLGNSVEVVDMSRPHAVAW